MKTYSDFIMEISSDELYEGLLGFGMFSEKIPPMFTSKAFFDFCKIKSFDFKDKWRNYAQYDSMRNNNTMRPLGIPHPTAYQLLCNHIQNNWDNIRNVLDANTQNQQYIISRIHIRKMGDSSLLFKMNYENWEKDGFPENDLIIGAKYMAKADVSKCFPSIYTHALVWAIIGKSNAKSEDGKNKDAWFNLLDHFVASCKFGETHGLLIGPHASNLLSELILTSVDKELYTKGWRFIRHIDDYECYVDSLEKAQLFIIELNAELRKYDISINEKKTEFLKLPIESSHFWIRRLNNVQLYYRKGHFDYKSTQSYLDTAISLLHDNKEDAAVLNYAIKALPKDDMTPQAIDYATKVVMSLCLIYPYLVHIIDEYVFERFEISKELIKEFSNKLFCQELKTKNYDAVCFALYFSLKYDFSITGLKTTDSIDSDSCIFKLLSFYRFKKDGKRKEETELRNHAKLLNNNNIDLDSNWLFVYEILPKNDLRSDLRKLKENNISFIDSRYIV